MKEKINQPDEKVAEAVVAKAPEATQAVKPLEPAIQDDGQGCGNCPMDYNI